MEKKEYQKPEIKEVKLIRILSKDIEGDRKLLHGLTEIKGISWAFSSAICKKLNLDKNKAIQDLTEEEIQKIVSFVKNPDLPSFIKNRRKDFDSGEDKHFYGADLDLRKEFDIKRIKKIKSYKGVRHQLGQPVRGQRTKSHFRANKKKSGASGGKKK